MDLTGTSTGTLLLGGAGANVAARILTYPPAVRWLSRATTAPVGSVIGSLASLRNIASSTGDQKLADIAAELEKVMPDEQKGANNGTDNRQK
jgi:hypothetical protein